MSEAMRHDPRVKAWAERLKARLDGEVEGDSGDQIRWLIQHLDEYLGRWLGFAESGRVKVGSTLNNDVFLVVVAALDVVDAVLEGRGCTWPFPQQSWERFRAAVDGIYDVPEQSQLALITREYESLRHEVLKSGN